MTIRVVWSIFSAVVMCFPPYLGIGCRCRGLEGLVQNLLLQFFTLITSKIAVSEIIFFILSPHKMTLQPM